MDMIFVTHDFGVAAEIANTVAVMHAGCVVESGIKQIVDAKSQFRSLAEPWADTGTSTGRLMIAVLGGLANVERDLIRNRTAEGTG
jgi:ABC-type sulfate/molybdate transport systems ATPase subunit